MPSPGQQDRGSDKSNIYKCMAAISSCEPKPMRVASDKRGAIIRSDFGDGAYLRRWLPELADAQLALLHEPGRTHRS
jgi:hypothetical protein